MFRIRADWCRLAIACALATSSTAAAAPSSSLQLGLNAYEFRYREQVTMPLKSTEQGFMPGVGLRYSGVITDDWFFSGSADFALASTKYDGSTQEGRPLVETNTHFFMNMNGTLGLTLVPGIAVYTGLGGRYWRRGGSYTEEYSWFYLPVGFRLQQKFGDDFKIGLDASARFMFGGLLRVNLSELESNLNNPQIGLGARLGYHVELPMAVSLSSSLAAVLAPWVEVSAIGQSEYFSVTQNSRQVAAGYEPGSRTLQYGALAGIEVSF